MLLSGKPLSSLDVSCMLIVETVHVGPFPKGTAQLHAPR